MSHSSGNVIFKDRTVMWCEYNGAGEYMVPQLHLTPAKMLAVWRNYADPPSCPHEGEPCLIYSYYGGGFWWSGRACRVCMRVISPLDPYADGVVTEDAPEVEHYPRSVEDAPEWVRVIYHHDDNARNGHRQAAGLTTGEPPYRLKDDVELPEMWRRL